MIFETPVVQAPMAGGASRPELVVAVAEAGGLGFLAAGYKTAAQVRDEITQVRARTGRPFGVNVFVPGDDPVDRAAVHAYQQRLRPEAERLGVELGEPKGGDDDWDAKLADLLRDPPPVVSFTFGCPSAEILRAFKERGTVTVVTVTSAAEARAAQAADMLCVQGVEAGAHQGGFHNDSLDGLELLPLLAEVAKVTAQPLIAAGGLGDAQDLARVLAAGAIAGQFGTAFLRCPESGASPVHKAALADPRFTGTALTRAFSGRPARGLVNRFMSEHQAAAPAAYPEIHNLTSPLRKAAAAQRDPGTMALWAGRAYRKATTAPAAETVRRLAG